MKRNAILEEHEPTMAQVEAEVDHATRLIGRSSQAISWLMPELASSRGAETSPRRPARRSNGRPTGLA